MAFGFPAYHCVRLSLLGSRQAARDAVVFSLDAAGWRYSEVSDGVFKAKVGLNGWSWGERLTVTLEEPNHITIESKCVYPLQCLDWGKNKQNVDLFLVHFEAREMRNVKNSTEPDYIDSAGRSPLRALVEDGE